MFRFTERLRDLGAATWLCIYPFGCTLAGLAALLWLDQGREVLVAIWEYGGGRWWSWFFLAVVSWALSAWYCARVLLSGPITGGRLGASSSPFACWLRVWLPRLLGAATLFPLAVKFFLLTHSWFPALPLFAFGAGFWVFVVYRRRWTNRLAEHPLLPSSARVRLALGPVQDLEPRVRFSTVAVCLISITFSFLLLTWFVLSPVEAPRRIGAAAISLFALSSWIVFGSIVLVLWPRLKGLPSLALLPLLTAGVASFWNDNHGIRPLDVAVEPPACFEQECVARAFADWFRTRAPRADGKVPVFVVSAAGGGQRAAYWTARTLGLLEDATDGEFSRQVFAISGVSGGSLGAATFAALIAQKNGVGVNTPTPFFTAACAGEFLSEDFLSPTLAYLFFPDLMQQTAIPFPIPALDRARALEASWVRSWGNITAAGEENIFAGSFNALWAGERRRRVPALFLNATVVESGQRMIVSSIPAGRDEFTDIVSAFDPRLDTWPISLATATHLSARFTYISPAAALRDARSGQLWGRVVDGGYHESSGALTAAEIVGAIERTMRRGEVPANRIELYGIIVSTHADEPRLCGVPPRQEPVSFLHEARAPFLALLRSREARGAHARVAFAVAAQRTAGAASDCDCFPGGWCNVFELAMPDVEEEPAFGWFLSARSRRTMDAEMRSGANREAMRRIVTAVTGRAPELKKLDEISGECRPNPR